MDNLQLNNSISEIETTINKLKNELDIIENEKKRMIEKAQFEQQRKKSDIENANIMRKALNYFARGYSTWETAEKISDYFPSVWDAYYYISSERAQNVARKRYARQYIVKALSDNGFPMSEIAKISGYSKQRCWQILKSGVI